MLGEVESGKLEKYPALRTAVLEAFDNNRRVNIEGARNFKLKVFENKRFATLTFWFVSSRQGYESLWTVLCKNLAGYWACSMSMD